MADVAVISGRELARRLHVSEAAVRSWQNRGDWIFGNPPYTRRQLDEIELWTHRTLRKRPARLATRAVRPPVRADPPPATAATSPVIADGKDVGQFQAIELFGGLPTVDDTRAMIADNYGPAAGEAITRDELLELCAESAGRLWGVLLREHERAWRALDADRGARFAFDELLASLDCGHVGRLYEAAARRVGAQRLEDEINGPIHARLAERGHTPLEDAAEIRAAASGDSRDGEQT